MNDFTWIPHIPLIGGFPLGAEKAFGKPPEFISSLEGFNENDQHYVHYQQITLGRNIEYKPLHPDDRSFHRKINVVVGTPPCAALSQLNTGTTKEAKGADCKKNDYMYIVAEQGIKCYDADVIIMENAPALYTNKGKPVADRLYQIAKENNYSFGMYKTSTEFHGLPQRRDRCFAFLWKNEHAPILNWYREDRKNFAEYLEEVPEDASQHNLYMNKHVANEPFYHFISRKSNRDPREVMIEDKTITAFNWVHKNGYLEEALQYFKDTNNERGIKYASHAINKFSQGLGIWDGSTHVFSDCMNALIGRNMNDTIHPKYDRSLSVREALHMMGFPANFELLHGTRLTNHIAQNVPVNTAACMVKEAIKFLNDELESSGLDYFKQNNHAMRYDTQPKVGNDSLEDIC